MKAIVILATIVVCGLVLSGVVWLCGSANPYTPAGYVGYVTRGAAFGQKKFISTQIGPTSPGRGWLLDVTNVSITPYTYSELFSAKSSVLSKDNLKIGFAVHIVWKIDSSKVRLFAEKFATLKEGDDPGQISKEAYRNFIREPLRTLARAAIQGLPGLEVKANIVSIGASIQKQLRETVANTPFDILSVVVGNIQYPEVVSAAVANKMAATQRLEQEDTEIAIEAKRAIKRETEAGGIAAAMGIINAKLTPEYLQHEAIEAQKLMVNSPNNTIVYIPVGNMGVPLTAMTEPERTNRSAVEAAKK
jgi:regulator of protease activity HflC (stomatin/prohibitin superfamily)